ncbi:hypothetical protein D3C81_696410 [compost metagenome]
MSIKTPPKSGTAPPARPVPAPLGVNGILFSLHILTTSETSSVECAIKTTSGAFFP